MNHYRQQKGPHSCLVAHLGYKLCLCGTGQCLFVVLLLYYQMDLEHSLGVWLPARTKHHCISDVFTFIHYGLDMLLHPQVSKSTPGPSHKQFFSPALPLTDSTHPLSPSLCILPWESIPFCFLWSESLSYLLQFKC